MQWLCQSGEQKIEGLFGCGGSSSEVNTFEYLAYYYAVIGKKEEAKKRLIELEELANKRFVPSHIIAVVYSALNDKDKTFEWLEKAYRCIIFTIKLKLRRC